MTNSYIRHAARTLVQNLGGRICDLPEYQLDAMAQCLESKRAYDRENASVWRTRRGAS